MNEINKTFEMFKDYVYSPELKELIASIQVMYNQKEKLQQRIDKAIKYVKDEIESAKGCIYRELPEEIYIECWQEILDILRGEDDEN